MTAVMEATRTSVAVGDPPRILSDPTRLACPAWCTEHFATPDEDPAIVHYAEWRDTRPDQGAVYIEQTDIAHGRGSWLRQSAEINIVSTGRHEGQVELYRLTAAQAANAADLLKLYGDQALAARLVAAVSAVAPYLYCDDTAAVRRSAP